MKEKFETASSKDANQSFIYCCFSARWRLHGKSFSGHTLSQDQEYQVPFLENMAAVFQYTRPAAAVNPQ
jgi:hypothetical protein